MVKGATPAGAGVLGIIPGSMASPGYVVRGKGSPESLHSASHGAGRVMSRTKAMQSFTWSATKKLLAERGVELLSAGLDEVPGVYKDIHAVMAAQTDLVEVLGQFDPKLVKVCPADDRAERRSRSTLDLASRRRPRQASTRSSETGFRAFILKRPA